LTLPENAGARVREWVLQSDAAPSRALVPELPSFMEPAGSSTEPFEIPASFEEHSSERKQGIPATSSSALFKTGIRGIFKRASIRRRVAKIKPPPLPVPVKPRARVVSKVLSIAAAVTLALGGWMFFKRTSLNKAREIIAQVLPSSQSSQKAAKKPV